VQALLALWRLLQLLCRPEVVSADEAFQPVISDLKTRMSDHVYYNVCQHALVCRPRMRIANITLTDQVTVTGC
jgi:hypothetical protein